MVPSPPLDLLGDLHLQLHVGGGSGDIDSQRDILGTAQRKKLQRDDFSCAGVNLPYKDAVSAGFGLVQRFRGTRVRHLGRNQDLRLVDVAQGDVGKIRRRQGSLIKRQVIGVTAVYHQNMDTPV